MVGLDGRPETEVTGREREVGNGVGVLTGEVSPEPETDPRDETESSRNRASWDPGQRQTKGVYDEGGRGTEHGGVGVDRVRPTEVGSGKKDVSQDRRSLEVRPLKPKKRRRAPEELRCDPESQTGEESLGVLPGTTTSAPPEARVRGSPVTY